MKTKVLVFLTLISLAFSTCNNFFHDLIPSDDDRIKSFSVSGQMDVEIGDNTIYVTVSFGTDISALIPMIEVDSGATVFPITYEYVARAFGDERAFGAAMELYTSGDMGDKVKDMIRDNKDNFAVPVLDLPINFVYPVDFLVVSARGTTRQYTVRIEIDTGEGKFRSFMFDKFFNPEMVVSAAGVVDTFNKTVTVNVSYPVENIASYQLTPVFETNGARVYLDNGTELRSGETLIDFVKPPDSSDLSNPDYAVQTKTLTLKRSGFPDAEWTLTVNFSEDPDTIRAITDFRFTKTLNPLIAADYMADIANNGSTGTISVTVYYGGAKPEELRASFVSPGTVTVNGDMQISGYSARDFSASVPYVVTSRVGNNVRTYTVTVNLVPASDPLPQITYFGLSANQNPQLLSNSTAMIYHNNRLILIEAAYDDDSPPVNLIPEFSATGTVTINGITQTSGSSSVNFSNPVEYTVSNPSNPALKREYRVEVQFVRIIPSAAGIETFSFYVADNPDLIADVHATVNQTTGAITATLLFDKNLPGGSRTLIPRWSAQGRVESNGITQTSGKLDRQFYTPLPLRAISADGVFRKDYTVTVKEVNTRIYVKHDATGRNDGTNWQNAYRNINDAGDDVNLFPYPISKEVWIAEGTYTVSNDLPIKATSYIGGFRGNEASVSARIDPANHKPVITGDQGGGSRLSSIFLENSFKNNDGTNSFEDLVITCSGTDERYDWGSAVYFSGGGGVIVFKGVDFIDTRASGNYGNGGAIRITNAHVIMTNCNFSNTYGSYSGGSVSIENRVFGSLTISSCNFSNTYAGQYGGAIAVYSASSVTITGCNFVNTSCPNVNTGGQAIFFWDCGNIEESGNNFNGISNAVVYWTGDSWYGD